MPQPRFGIGPQAFENEGGQDLGAILLAGDQLRVVRFAHVAFDADDRAVGQDALHALGFRTDDQTARLIEENATGSDEIAFAIGNGRGDPVP